MSELWCPGDKKDPNTDGVKPHKGLNEKYQQDSSEEGIGKNSHVEGLI